MELELKVGSVVQLKCGGPIMTVVSIGDLDCVATCVWFNKSMVRMQGFRLEILKHWPHDNRGLTSHLLGSVVQLKSGGPRMVISGSNPVYCSWFASNDDIAMRFQIPLEALEDAVCVAAIQQLIPYVSDGPGGPGTYGCDCK
jgi:uncharacterized protein YodC (DUF2158 family)